MRILFCSPEVTPFAKTGGLADVSGALPLALRARGIDCRVAMPLYRKIKETHPKLEIAGEISFFGGDGLIQSSVYRKDHVYFIDHPEYFRRDGIYTYANQDFPDNLQRFSFFSRACVELLQLIGDVDVVHCNDWQSALVFAYMHALDINQAAKLYTIHNLAYQGNFDVSCWPQLFLPQELFTPDHLEYYGHINVMKAGLSLADAINTVSPTYAREIQTPQNGFGLDGLLRAQSHRLSGIINGIDYEVWNPAADTNLAAPYDLHAMAGKGLCKSALQQELNLAEGDRPIFGMICRMVEQKGIELVLNILPELIRDGAQFAILGSGEGYYEDWLRNLAHQFPHQIGLKVGFDDALAHRIEAGSDFFLMPSRFEPCGLNQMISMRYGTIPIVTPVGGLKDSVPEECGIIMENVSAGALLMACRCAISIYNNQSDFCEMRKRAMQQDFSWQASADSYIRLYEQICS